LLPAYFFVSYASHFPRGESAVVRMGGLERQ
jgi:hypothetical protein